MNDKKDAAVATLENLGYTHEGGSLWKPPLGKAPDFNMLDSLRARAASLEDQLIAQANRAVIAEQQVTALTQRLDMANRLNTDARNQLAQLSARQAAPDALEMLAPDFYVRPSIAAFELPWGVCMHEDSGSQGAYLAETVRTMLTAAPEPYPRSQHDLERLVGNWFSEGWAKKAAFGMLDDYELTRNRSHQ